MNNYSIFEDSSWRKEPEISINEQQHLLEVYALKSPSHPPLKNYTLNRAAIEWLIIHFNTANLSKNSNGDSIGLDLREARFPRGIDLSKLPLNHAVLRGVNLEEAFMYGIHLEYGDISHSILTNAHMPHAVLSFTNLSGTNLDHAFLDNAMLEGTDFTGASLIDCTLTGATLKRTQMNQANLTGAFLDMCVIEDTEFTQAITAGVHW